MEDVPSHYRSEVQAVETTLALILGALVAAVLAACVWLSGVLLELDGPGWSTARSACFSVALAAGAGTAVWWLVRVRRRGL